MIISARLERHILNNGTQTIGFKMTTPRTHRNIERLRDKLFTLRLRLEKVLRQRELWYLLVLATLVGLTFMSAYTVDLFSYGDVISSWSVDETAKDILCYGLSTFIGYKLIKQLWRML